MSANSANAHLYIGTAGWSIRAEAKPQFGEGISQLHRYATRFNAVEINSSFYRPHKPATYARWAQSVSDDFRFAVKMPRQITHETRLRNCAELLEGFVAQVSALGSKLGPLLVQIPPSLAFDAILARTFFGNLRDIFPGLVAFEPRHASWFTNDVNDLLLQFKIARVAADPAPVAAATNPGGWHGFVYFRLHGSPRIYHSRYEMNYLRALAVKLRARSNTWCIFDNTALGAATVNGFETVNLLSAAALIYP